MTQTATRTLTPATRDLIRWGPVVYLAATAVGVAMRLVEVGWQVPVPFDHLLHAHSHALYFGWAGLVILVSVTTGPLPRRPVRDPRWWALVLVPVMAAAFLIGGYSPLSIAASTAVMTAWYVAIWRWWQAHRTDLSPLESVERTGFVYVLVATGGIWVLAPMEALEIGPPLASRLAIHAFLSTFAWFFVLGTAGLAVRAGLSSPETTRRVVRWLAPFAWLTFPLGVMGGAEVAGLGPMARLAGVALLVPIWRWIRHLWRRSAIDPCRRALRMAAAWLGMAALGLAAVGLGGSSVLAAAGRHGIVLFLHALLLGYVTAMLAWYLARRVGIDIARALTLHHLGVGMMLAGLALAVVAGAWYSVGQWLAATGAIVTWLAGMCWARPVWKASR